VAHPHPEPAGPNDSVTHSWPDGHVPLQAGAVEPHWSGTVVVVVVVVGGPTRAGAQSRKDFRDRSVYVANWSVAWNVPGARSQRAW
jgi:hypothetical protein